MQRLSGARYKAPGHREESGVASQTGFNHKPPVISSGTRQAGGQKFVLCCWWPRMVDGSLNVIVDPEGNPSEEIVHAGAREGGEVPVRLSEGEGSGGN